MGVNLTPSPPLPCGHPRVLGIVASSQFQEDLVLVPSGLWAGAQTGEEDAERGPLGARWLLEAPAGAGAFRAQDQSLDSLLRRGAEISFHMPARHPGSSHPFPEAVRPLWRAGMCLSWLDAPRTLHAVWEGAPPPGLPQGLSHRKGGSQQA